jgi:hypothetical protein
LPARWPESRAGVPELRRNGRYVGASLGCEALRRVLWGVRWPHCLDARRRGALQAYLGENPRAIVRWRQTATRAILQPYQLFPDCIIATLGRDFREGQGALHVVLSLFLHLVAGRRRGGALLSNYPCHSHEYRLFAIRTSAGPQQPLRILIAGNHDEATMGILFVWVIEFIKLLGRRRLHPLNAECPICHQMVRLHYNKAGRRHLLAHARACSLTLYEGARYCVHYTAKIKCLGSGTLAKFDPRPNENQHFKLPKFLELEGWSTSSSERGDVRLRTRTDRQSGHSHSAVP